MTKCEHWDAGWCYAPVDVKTNAIGKFGVCKLPEYCPYLKSQNQMNEIQQTKEDIAVLQEKLKKLEELEIQKSKSPAEEAYKGVYGWYPPTTPSVSNSEDERWSDFQKGYVDAVEEWLPDELVEYDGEFADAYAYDRGWNAAIRTIKYKLR